MRTPVLALIMALSSPLMAQGPRTYPRAIDVLDYDLSLDLPDTGSVIHGTATLTVRRSFAVDSVLLDLVGLTVDGVRVDGRPVAFSRTPTTIVVPLPKGGGLTYHVKIDYGGVPTDGLIIRTDSAGRWTGFGDNWPTRARYWFPSVDDPSDKATVTWTVRAAEERTVVANGRLIYRKRYTSKRDVVRVETRWREDRPITTYMMVIAAAPLARFDLRDTNCGLAKPLQCVPQFVYTAPEQRGDLPGPFARARDIVRFYSTLLGPFPYEKLAHVQSSTRYGGAENASAIFYADEFFRTGGLASDPSLSFAEVVAHETAHQWFGDAVTEREWSHLWLSEGFATYFAALWERAANGDAAFRTRMERIRQAVLNDTTAVPKRPVIDTIETDLMALLNRNSYEKGAFVLHMLRDQVGERAFFPALRRYYAAHRHATAVTDDLRIAMERASGQQLGWFFDQWLHRPGFPELTVEWFYDSATHEVAVGVTQDARFGRFRVPVTISVTDSNGVTRRTRVQLTGAVGDTVRRRIPLATSPNAVTVDPDVILLASTTIRRR